jgi:hypothetical protein
MTDLPTRHAPSTRRNRVLISLLAGAVCVCIVGGIVWHCQRQRHRPDASTYAGLLAGSVLVALGVAHAAQVAIAYFRAPATSRTWTTRDTTEMGVSVAFVAAGVAFLCNASEIAEMGAWLA